MTWHIDHHRETGVESAEAVLATLQAAYPEGVPSTELIRLHGPAAKSRVGELKTAGWDIESPKDRALNCAVYRLRSVECGAKNPKHLGVTAALDAKDGLAVRVHGSLSGRVSEATLQRIEREIGALLEAEPEVVALLEERAHVRDAAERDAVAFLLGWEE